VQLPRRVFLDTNVVNFVLDHGESIFDGEEPDAATSDTDLADVRALHLIFLTGERTHWELAVSPLTHKEIMQTTDHHRRQSLERWFNEVWCHWRDCMAEDGGLSDDYADELASKVGSSSLLLTFPDVQDRILICHAIAYECDAFCTRDRRTILKRVSRAPALPLEIMSPAEWGEPILAIRGGF